MSTRSGKTTNRKKVDSHIGYSIIRVTTTEWYKPSYSSYYTNIPNNVKTHYDFCKEGEETKPSKAYECGAKNVAECKECIEKFLKDDSTYFTHEEREKYVYKPNHKCGWAYGYDSLMKLLKEHKKSTKRMKILIEDRLEDANFHAECGLLANGDYDGFVKLVRKDYPFNEKFEVYTSTECKRIKDPKQFEDGLAKAISDYLASQGVKDTSVNVRFIEDW